MPRTPEEADGIQRDQESAKIRHVEAKLHSKLKCGARTLTPSLSYMSCCLYWALSGRHPILSRAAQNWRIKTEKNWRSKTKSSSFRQAEINKRLKMRIDKRRLKW